MKPGYEIVKRAGLGDRALAAAFPGGVLGRHDPEKPRQPLRSLKAPEVADLGGQPARAERVDPAKAAQPGDRDRERRRRPRFLQPAIERIAPGDSGLHGREIVDEGRLRAWVVEAKTGDPRHPLLRPRLGLRAAQLAAQQELAEPVTMAHEIAAGVTLATA
jgi:hypothetical protein